MTLLNQVNPHTWREDLASGHSEVWLATAIILWSLFMICLALYLATKRGWHVKLALAGILLYEVLP